MFSNLGWGEILVLVVAALVILGPERLPGAISWTMQSIRKVRDYATGASKDLQDQMGTDFDSIREPLQQLNELRQMTPKALVTKHLFEGDSAPLDQMESTVRDSLSLSGPAAANPHPGTAGPDAARLADTETRVTQGSSSSGASNAGGGATQVDPSRLNADHAPPPATAPRRHDVTDWDAT